MGQYNKILVLCQGNICRSPVAEAMLKRIMPGKQIQSAGFTAMVGHGADATALEIANINQLDLSAHISKQVNKDMMQWSDLILVMSHAQRGQVGHYNPEALGKTLLMGHWLTLPNQQKEIPDPYKKSRDVFEHVHKLLEQSVDLWASKI